MDGIVPAGVARLFELLEPAGSPGAAVAVLQDGEVICRRGYGLADITAGEPFTPQTEFAIASMTKQFTTTCLLLLEDEGRLSLQDDYRTYLPEMPDFGATVTLGHLSSNTSGIRDIFALTTLSGGYWLDPRPRTRLESTLAHQRTLNFPTGSQYRYSNPNFALLSWIIERITGRRLADFMAERIFQPLGMSSTKLQDLREPPKVGGARAYDGTSRDDLRPSRWEAFSRSGSGEGGGAIWSTLDDLVRWERNFDQPSVGHPGLFQRLALPPDIPGIGPSSYAHGLFVGSHRGQRYEGHSGGFGPCACNRLRLPDVKLSVIILSNSALVDPHVGAFDAVDAMLDQDPAVAPSTPPKPAHADRLEPWFGTYEDPRSGLPFALTAREGVAHLVTFGFSMKLEEVSPGVLLAGRGGSLPVRVRTGRAGPVPEIELQLGPNRPLQLERSPPPTTPVRAFEGEYFSDELQATHSVSLRNGEPEVTIVGPGGRIEGMPLERLSETSFVAHCHDHQRIVYRFGNESGWPGPGATVSIARAEGLRMHRL